MEVLLKQDIPNLGDKGEMVSVKPGYGRNYLIPQGYAILATPSVRKMHTETLKQRAHKEEKLIKEANATVEKLSKAAIKIVTKAGESGKIFGSVSNIQVADALKGAGFDIDRKNIKMQNDTIKTLGTYTCKVKLHKTITTDLQFEVVSE